MAGVTVLPMLQAVLAEQMGLSDPESLALDLDADLEEVLALDSLDAFELLLAIEERFEIEIPEDQVLAPVADGGIRTLRQWDEFVGGLVAAKAVA